MKEVFSDMAGMVIDVNVEVGQQLEEGQTIATLESMKMEIPIVSTATGVLKEIKIDVGSFVNEGEVIIILG